MRSSSRSSIWLTTAAAISQRNLQKVVGAGPGAVGVPESIGGAGPLLLEHCAIGEEIAYGYLGVNTSVQGNSLAAMPLLIVDNPDLNKSF